MSEPRVAVERSEDLAALEADWKRLAGSADHPFSSWEWGGGWWRHLGEGLELAAFAVRDEDGRTAAILPLYSSRLGPFRVARFFGEGDLRGPVCAAADRPLAAAGLRAAIRSMGGTRLLIAERLPGGAGWGELIGGRRVATHPDPALPLAGLGWEDWLASRSRNFRQQLRRRRDRLVEEHGLGFRLCDDPATLGADFEALVRLHESRWDGESSGVFAGARGEFQREFAAAALERGWLRLWLAEIAGETVAAWYGWRFAGSEWYYQAGRDTRYDDLSLGFVLLAHTVREAADEGVAAYRFLDGAEPYKWRFASDDLEAESIALGRGAAGALGAASASLAVRARRALRRAPSAGGPS